MELEPVKRLSRDLANAGRILNADQARFIVDSYYAMQRDRIRVDNQIRALSESGEPTDMLLWLTDQNETLEKQLRRALQKYAEAHPVGGWLTGVCGIGPVIAAGLFAHIDIHKARTSGAIWRFAGLDITSKWEKGQKRPYNAELKVLCWKAGESFVKVSNNENSIYGSIYKTKKNEENRRNEAGELADQAKAVLASKNIGKTTDAYKAYIQGKLPPAHIHARATRYAVKIFLSHLFEVWYRYEFQKEPPEPYVIAHLKHTHKIFPEGLAWRAGANGRSYPIYDRE